MARGPGTNEEQIQSLRSRMSDEAIAMAENLVASQTDDVVALAYKLNRKEAKNKLPKSVVDLIAKLPADEAKQVRSKLLGVK
jgi:DNA primase